MQNNQSKTELHLIQQKKSTVRPADEVQKLEAVGGNLKKYEEMHIPASYGAESWLFVIETALAKPENTELRQRWESALRISEKIRMDKLKCKAFEVLEQYQNLSANSSASDVAFARAVLGTILRSDSAEQAAPAAKTKEEQDMDSLEDEFDKAERED